MRIISSPVFQLRDIIHALLTSSSPSYDLISTFLTYGQLLGATSIHGYLVDRSYDTQTLINEEFSSYQGAALCITYDIKLSEQQWEDIFGIHESTSIISKTTSSFFHLTDFLCILSGSRVVYYDLNERMINDERAYVSIFDLENDDIEMFEDQFSPLDYFLLKSKTFFNGTLIRLPLQTNTSKDLGNKIQTLDDIKDKIYKYFYSNNSLIDLLLAQTSLNTILFDYTKDFQIFNRFLSIEKYAVTTIHDSQSTTHIIHLTLSKLINDINTRFVIFSSFPWINRFNRIVIFFSDVSRWLLSIHNDYSELTKSNIELKLLLPLIPLNETYQLSSNHQLIQITSRRILYYSIPSLIKTFFKDDICTQLREIKFPQAYALFLKDLSRLIKPTTISNLSIDLIWELMPDIDEHQRLINSNHKYSLQQQQYIQIINNIIPDIWREIGKKKNKTKQTEVLQ